MYDNGISYFSIDPWTWQRKVISNCRPAKFCQPLFQNKQSRKSFVENQYDKLSPSAGERLFFREVVSSQRKKKDKCKDLVCGFCLLGSGAEQELFNLICFD